jgi:hypothetical protein
MPVMEALIVAVVVQHGEEYSLSVSYTRVHHLHYLRMVGMGLPPFSFQVLPSHVRWFCVDETLYRFIVATFFFD